MKAGKKKQSISPEFEFFVRSDLSRYRGKYVAIVGKRVAASGDHAKKVWEAAKKKHPGKLPTLAKLPREEVLGFTISRAHEISEIKGIGEKGVPILIRRLKMWLGDYGFTARVAWCLTEGVPPLLGREDIFNLFSITFERNHTTVIRTA